MEIDVVPPHLEEAKPENLVELVNRYKKSTWYTVLSPATMKRYDDNIMSMLRSPYGYQPIDRINKYTADVIYTTLKEKHGEHSAKYFVAVWHRIMEFAVKHEYIIRNPWDNMQVTTPPPRQVVWTEEQVFTAVGKAIELGSTELAKAICLLYDTGQRPQDILYLRYEQIKKDNLGVYVDIRQKKRGAEVKPALSKYTIGLLGGEEYILNQKPNEYGSPFVLQFKNKSTFNYQWRELKKVLPEEFKKLQLRDLRRSAITEMGNASDDIMLSVSGHSERDMLNIYSVRSRHKALEAQRIRHATRNSKLNTEFTPTSGEEKGQV